MQRSYHVRLKFFYSSHNPSTQNIDRLHVFTLKSRQDRIAEVHGRLGLYKWFEFNLNFANHRF